MLIIIKSGQDTVEAKRAVKTAKDSAGDIVLIQNAVYLAEKERLEGFCGTVYALDEDLRLRGVVEIGKNIKKIGYAELVRMCADDKTVGAF